MGDIVEFILDHFSSLTPIDYLLLVLIAGSALVALFKTFQWLYAERFKSQTELLDLKDDVIGELRDRLEQASMTSKELEIAEKTAWLSGDMDTLKSVQAALETARIKTVSLVMTKLFILEERLMLTHQFLADDHVRDSRNDIGTDVASLTATANDLEKLLSKSIEAIDHLEYKSPGDLTEKIWQIGEAPELSQAADKLLHQTRELLARLN